MNRRAGLAPAALSALAASDARIVVTGAGGWLGLATLELLRDALGPAFGDRVVAYGASARTLRLRDAAVEQRPLGALSALSAAPTWLFHYAFLTKDRAAAMDELAYEAACTAIRRQVLSALEPIGVETVFLASSGAAARVDDGAASREMRLYGRLKREDEDAFAGWAQATGRGAAIARVFNLTGPYINKHQLYAIASFVLDALAGRPIAVRAPRPVVRGYVAIRELVSLALGLFAGERALTRFDTGGVPLELGAVAQTVVDALGGQVDRAPITSDQADRYVGDPARYAGLLAQHHVAPVTLDRQIIELADYLREVTYGDVGTGSPDVA